MKAEIRKAEILTAAVEVASRYGYMNMRREDIAKLAGCATGSVNNYYGTMSQLRRAVMREAIHTNNYTVIAQGLAHKDRCALKAPPEVKQAVIESILG